MSRSPETRDGTASAVPPSATDRPTGERPGDGAPSGDGDSRRMPRWAPSSLLRWARRCAATLVRLTSLRLRLIMVFGLVALTAAVSVSGIAYWLNRDAVLTRAQNLALDDFHQALGHYAGSLPPRPGCAQLRGALEEMAPTTLSYEVVLTDVQTNGEPCVTASAPRVFSLDDVPGALRRAVQRQRPVEDGDDAPYHLYWQRISRDGVPFLVGGAKLNGDGATGFMLKSLAPERDDLNSLAWSLGIATALALLVSALLAQAAASTVLRPVRRLGDAARKLGEGKLDTRLRVTGTDELAELSRTFNRTAEALEARVADLSAREAASRRFVADMSHELRTPLTAITAVTEVLEEEADALDPMIEPAVRLVISETRRLNDLVENLMEVTRFDAGTAKLVLDDVDVADQVIACIDARAWLDAVELDAEHGIAARLDPRRLDVILANLIGNALKHGGSPVRVAVRTEGEELYIRVSDQGPGIPEEVLPHVFDRFYKASASRPRSEGSGLGLSIAMENALIHGGDITAANAPEGGAVFTLRLPRDARELAESAGRDGDEGGDQRCGQKADQESDRKPTRADRDGDATTDHTGHGDEGGGSATGRGEGNDEEAATTDGEDPGDERGRER